MLVIANPALLDLAAALGIGPTLPRLPGIVAGWYEPGWEERWANTVDILRYLVARARSHYGARLYISSLPSPFQVSEAHRKVIEAKAAQDDRFDEFLMDPERPQRLLEAFCLEEQVPFIDTTAELRRADAGGPVFFVREGHLNENGAEEVARILFDRIGQDL